MTAPFLPSSPILTPSRVADVGGLAELWRTLLPWEDLNAKSIPERYLNLGRDILPVMAVLVASGGVKPELLEADDDGALITSFSGGSSTFATAPAAIGTTVITCRSVEIFKKGGQVLIVGGDNSPVQGQTIFRGPVKGLSDVQITIDPLPVAVSVNDTVVAVPQFSTDIIDRATRLLGTTDVIDRAARLLGHVTIDGQPISSDVTDRVGRLLGHVLIDGQPISVQEAANPPAWQYPTNWTSLENAVPGSTSNLVAGVANQKVRLFGWEIIASKTGDFGTIRQGGPGSFNRIATADGVNGGPVHLAGTHHGAAVTVAGDGLQLDFPVGAVGGVVRCSLSYSQF